MATPERILEDLLDYLDNNIGRSPDWPLQITEDAKAALVVANKLRDARRSLQQYAASKEKRGGV